MGFREHIRLGQAHGDFDLGTQLGGPIEVDLLQAEGVRAGREVADAEAVGLRLGGSAGAIDEALGRE